MSSGKPARFDAKPRRLREEVPGRGSMLLSEPNILEEKGRAEQMFEEGIEMKEFKDGENDTVKITMGVEPKSSGTSCFRKHV